MKRRAKFLTMISIVILLLLSANVAVFALSSSDITVNSPSHGYYFRDALISYSVNVDGSSNNPATVSISYPYNLFNNNPRISLAQLYRVGTSFTYTGSSTPNIWIPGRKPGTHGSWQTRGFYVQATKNGITVDKKASGYITAWPQSNYYNIDSTFWYSSSTQNPFLGVGTPAPEVSSLTYNCLSYAVSIDNSWQWPWNCNPTVSELDAYMSKSGNYSSRDGYAFTASSFNGCDVIYYSDENWGTGDDGHFARVMAWDASGNPTIITSKWGPGEVIQSNSYCPFNSSTSSYGAPKRYYKYSVN